MAGFFFFFAMALLGHGWIFFFFFFAMALLGHGWFFFFFFVNAIKKK